MSNAKLEMLLAECIADYALDHRGDDRVPATLHRTKRVMALLG